MKSVRQNARVALPLVLLPLISIAALFMILSGMVERIVVWKAETAAAEWVGNRGQPPSSPAGSGEVARYDATGHPTSIGASAGQGRDPTAAEAAAVGAPVSREVPVPAGAGPRLATFVPIPSAHGPVVVRVDTDLAPMRAVLRQDFLITSLELSLLIACSLGVPALAFFWQTRQKRRGEARIEYLAHHDAQTGLLNRATFAAGLAEAIVSMTSRGSLGAVHFIDLDRFKAVNDSLGHGVGDALIRAVAHRLDALCGGHTEIARFGGDEFVIAQLDVSGVDDAEHLAKRIRETLAEPFTLGPHVVSVAASIGVSIAPRDGGDAETVIKAADTAMYRAKGDGRDTIRVYSPEMDAELQQRRDIEAALRQALDTEGFALNFQPIIEAQTNRLLGFETLLRLPQATGNISPAVFVPIAEEMGLIMRIGEWVLRRACAVAVGWPDHLTVAVNLSPKQFENGEIDRLVADVLRETGLPAHRLELEITEGLLLHETTSVLEQLSRLKRLGVSIAMDDFGTGYSSLSYLWRFPFDKLKIDRSFMSVLSSKDENIVNILRTIVSLGRTLNLQVTAEGIETQYQADVLVGLNCNQLQGYHFGTPMPETDLAALIAHEVQSVAAVGRSPQRMAPLRRTAA